MFQQSRARICEGCGEVFAPRTSSAQEVACSPKCAAAVIRAAREPKPPPKPKVGLRCSHVGKSRDPMILCMGCERWMRFAPHAPFCAKRRRSPHAHRCVDCAVTPCRRGCAECAPAIAAAAKGAA